jgi:hypothetical protein
VELSTIKILAEIRINVARIEICVAAKVAGAKYHDLPDSIQRTSVYDPLRKMADGQTCPHCDKIW